MTKFQRMNEQIFFNFKIVKSQNKLKFQKHLNQTFLILSLKNTISLQIVVTTNYDLQFQNN